MTGSTVAGRIRRAATRMIFGEDGRPRAVYRATVAVFIGIVGLFVGDAATTLPPIEGGELELVVQSVASAVAVVSGLAVTAHYFDHRPLADYGFKQTRGWVVNVIVGGFAGVTVVGVAFGVGMGAKSIRVVEAASVADVFSLLPALAVAMVSFVAVGVLEEVVFRGAVLTNIAEGVATRSINTTTALGSAWLVSSLIFGVIHGPLGHLPSGASRLGMFIVWTTAGGVLGLAYLLTGQLALPIGLHTGVNWAANYVFLATAEPAVVQIEFRNRALWHPMAGLPLLAGWGVAVGLIMGYVAWQRGSLRPHKSILQATEELNG